MSKREKFLHKLRNNKTDWRISDLIKIARQFSIKHEQPGTSHVTFRFPSRKMLTVPARKPIKPIYIKKFIELIDELKEAEQSET